MQHTNVYLPGFMKMIPVTSVNGSALAVDHQWLMLRKCFSIILVKMLSSLKYQISLFQRFFVVVVVLQWKHSYLKELANYFR